MARPLGFALAAGTVLAAFACGGAPEPPPPGPAAQPPPVAPAPPTLHPDHPDTWATWIGVSGDTRVAVVPTRGVTSGLNGRLAHEALARHADELAACLATVKITGMQVRLAVTLGTVGEVTEVVPKRDWVALEPAELACVEQSLRSRSFPKSAGLDRATFEVWIGAPRDALAGTPPAPPDLAATRPGAAPGEVSAAEHDEAEAFGQRIRDEALKVREVAAPPAPGKGPVAVSGTSGRAPFTVKVTGPPELVALGVGKAEGWKTCGFTMRWGDGARGVADCAAALSHTYGTPGTYQLQAQRDHRGPTDAAEVDWLSDPVTITVGGKARDQVVFVTEPATYELGKTLLTVDAVLASPALLVVEARDAGGHLAAVGASWLEAGREQPLGLSKTPLAGTLAERSDAVVTLSGIVERDGKAASTTRLKPMPLRGPPPTVKPDGGASGLQGYEIAPLLLTLRFTGDRIDRKCPDAAVVAWGDGTESPVTLSGPACGTESALFPTGHAEPANLGFGPIGHRYEAPGDYAVRLRGVDKDASVVISTTIRVTGL